jgi:hypothetical protein
MKVGRYLVPILGSMAVAVVWGVEVVWSRFGRAMVVVFVGTGR